MQILHTMASILPLLPIPRSNAPKRPNPNISNVCPIFFSSAFIHCNPRHSKTISASRDESSLHHLHTHAKALDLVSRLGFMRRDALLAMLLTAASFPFLAMGSFAETDFLGSFYAYEDEANKFRIFVPKGWSVGTGETSSIKSVIAFYPEEASNSNVSVTITGVGPDFTSLGSFGKVDAFAETLVNGLDRSWQRPPGIAAKLINSAAANGLYYIEYTLQNPGERCRHIFSAIGMASNGWYNRLYTVTGQFLDDVEATHKSQVEKSVLSFRLM